MTSSLINLDELIWGPMLSETRDLPLSFRAIVGDLRSRMIAKGRVARGYRAVARNGRILLASNRPLDDLAGREAQVRVQTWQRVILPGDAPELCGLVLCVRCLEPHGEGLLYRMHLVRGDDDGYDLALAVGGGVILAVYENSNQ